MHDAEIYAQPRIVDDLRDCRFYHSMEIPGYGLVEGEEWDLRGRSSDYLGGVDVNRKRVLEIGTASGFLCFEMERMGADVVAFDLSENENWDVVPYYDFTTEHFAEWKRQIKRINNAYWLAHRAFRSKARVVYGSVYAIPEEIGPVDISIFGCVLLHLRDPFLALQQALRLTRETVIVTDLPPKSSVFLNLLDAGLKKLHIPIDFDRKLAESSMRAAPSMRFVPNYRSKKPPATWWRLPPPLIMRFLGVLGFDTTGVTFHMQRHRRAGTKPMYTIVARRNSESRHLT